MPSSPKVGHAKPKIGAIAALKECIKSGWLFKTGFAHKGWKKRFCVMTADTLYYFSDANAASQKGEVILSEVTDVGLTDKTGKYLKKENVITLFTPHRPFFFAAATPEEATLWIEKVSDRITTKPEEKKDGGQEVKKEETKKPETETETPGEEEEKKEVDVKQSEEKKDEVEDLEDDEKVEEEKEEKKEEPTAKETDSTEKEEPVDEAASKRESATVQPEAIAAN